jgi:hypothetical protein
LKVDIKRSGSLPSQKGSAERFTGNDRIDPQFTAPEPAHISIARFTFEPGAAPATPMTHLSCVERLYGKSANWLKRVSDEQYQGL